MFFPQLHLSVNALLLVYSDDDGDDDRSRSDLIIAIYIIRTPVCANIIITVIDLLTNLLSQCLSDHRYDHALQPT